MSQPMQRKHQTTERGGVFSLVEVDDGEQIGYLTYGRPEEGRLVVDYVEVDPRHRRQGFAKQLVEEVVDFADDEELGLEATCPVARGIMEQMGAL